MNIAEYLFSTLQKNGLQHCFGLPGDYVLPLYHALEKQEGIEAIVGTHEPNAAFSADGYARLKDLSALVLTYGVGALNALNGIACAYAESAPVVVISGAPVRNKNTQNSPVSVVPHHVIKDEFTQLHVFEQILEKAVRLENSDSAGFLINDVIHYVQKFRKPAYLEIPYDLMTQNIHVNPDLVFTPSENYDTLNSYFQEKLKKARHPVFLIGAEVGRYQLQPFIRNMLKTTGIPAVLTPLAKGVLEEDGKLCYGVYAGVVSSSKDIRTFVEQADLVIMLGTKMTDVNCGIFTADIDQEKILIAKNGYAGSYTECVNDNLDFYRFITGFAQFIGPKAVRQNNLKIPPFQIPQTNSVMDQYLRIIEEHITKEHVIVADTGDSCYGSLAMRMKSDNSYFAPLFYNTMGYAVPASVGIQLAMPDKRPVVLVGDGAFQMTGMELSTSLRLGLNPIIIVFNNSGYGMQRVFQDGNFNTLTPWNYTSITELIGGGIAQKVETVQKFQNALQNAIQTKDSLFVIEALVPKGDISTGLKIFTDAAKREKTGICPFLEKPDHVCSVSSSCGFCRASIWQE